MLRDGCTSLDAIAKATGCSPGTVRKWADQLRRDLPGWRWCPERPRREATIQQLGTFLNEDLAQERALAELEGRAFDRTAFYRQHLPQRELAILDRPLGDGDTTLHDLLGGDSWLTERISGGNYNHAEERMVRRLDREPSLEELRAGVDDLPWQAYVHAVSLEEAEPAVCAWLEFIPRMTADEYAEINLEAQIEAILPGLSMGEVLRAAREALAWSERDLERRAGLLPGVVRRLERAEMSYRDCALRAIADALSAVGGLQPGQLKAQLGAVWGRAPSPVPQRRVIVESERRLIEQRRAPLTQSLGDLLRQSL